MSKNYRSGFERLTIAYPEKNERYAVALAEVRQNFRGFTRADGYDSRRVAKLTENQRHQIRRYYNLLRDYVERGPVYRMSPSELPKSIRKAGKKGIDAVMRAAQMPEGRKRAKYIFIEFDGETIPTVSVKDGSPVFVNKRLGYMRETIELDQVSLAINPVDTVMSVAGLTRGAIFYRVLNKKTDFYGPTGTRKGAALDLKTLANEIVRLQEKYRIGTKDSWDRWLVGIAAYYSDGKTVDQVINHLNDSRDSYREKVKREQKKIRRKRK